MARYVVMGQQKTTGFGSTAPGTGAHRMLNDQTNDILSLGANTTARVNTLDCESGTTLSLGSTNATLVNSAKNFAVGTDKFTVNATSGNTVVAGTLDSTGDFAVGTDKFTAEASTGNTDVGGTLGVTGASTFTGAATFNAGVVIGSGQNLTAAASNDLVVEAPTGQDVLFNLGDAAGTNKFSVRDSATTEVFYVDSDGNTVIQGDLTVNGTTTTVNTELQTADDFILLNSDYVSSTAKRAGFAFNVDPADTNANATGDGTAGTGFDTTTSVEIDTDLSLASGDFILVQGADSADNLGIYEVSSYAASGSNWKVTIKGTPTADLGLGTQFTVDTNDNSATIVQVALQYLRAKTGGGFEVAYGDSSGSLSWATLESSGSTTTTLQDAYDNGNGKVAVATAKPLELTASGSTVSSTSPMFKVTATGATVNDAINEISFATIVGIANAGLADSVGMKITGSDNGVRITDLGADNYGIYIDSAHALDLSGSATDFTIAAGSSTALVISDNTNSYLICNTSVGNETLEAPYGLSVSGNDLVFTPLLGGSWTFAEADGSLTQGSSGGNVSFTGDTEVNGGDFTFTPGSGGAWNFSNLDGSLTQASNGGAVTITGNTSISADLTQSGGAVNMTPDSNSTLSTSGTGTVSWTIKTGDTTSTNSGSVIFRTGGATSGNSGDITLTTGTASSTRGSISMDGYTYSLSTDNDISITAGNSWDVTSNAASSITVSGAALSIDSGAASTWKTSAGALTVEGSSGVTVQTPNATSGNADDVTLSGGDGASTGDGGDVHLLPGSGGTSSGSDGNVHIGSSSQGAFDSPHLVIGSYHLWIDGSNLLRIKNGAPASATDGTVVGEQSAT